MLIFSFTMDEVEEGFDCNSPATDLELTLTTDFLPVEMFVMKLEVEDMFEPVAISVSDLEPAAMSGPEGALIQFDYLKWSPTYVLSLEALPSPLVLSPVLSGNFPPLPASYLLHLRWFHPPFKLLHPNHGGHTMFPCPDHGGHPKPSHPHWSCPSAWLLWCHPGFSSPCFCLGL